MKFAPKTKEEAFKVELLEKGNYPFIVLKATQEISQSGNDMVKVLLKIWDDQGREHLVNDYLMPQFEWKLRRFCYSINLGEMSEKGEFDCDLVKNKQGVCKIYIKEDKTGEYSDKNAVADYIVNEDNAESFKKENGNSFKDDELPF